MLFLPKRKDLKYNLTKVLKQDKEMWVVGGCSNQWFSVLRSQVSSQSSLVRNANPQTQPQTFWLGCLWSCSDASVPGKFENPCSRARKVWELVVKTQVKGNGMDVCLAGETDYFLVPEWDVLLFLRGENGLQRGRRAALSERWLSYTLALLLRFRSFNLHIS